MRGEWICVALILLPNTPFISLSGSLSPSFHHFFLLFCCWNSNHTNWFHFIPNAHTHNVVHERKKAPKNIAPYPLQMSVNLFDAVNKQFISRVMTIYMEFLLLFSSFTFPFRKKNDFFPSSNILFRILKAKTMCNKTRFHAISLLQLTHSCSFARFFAPHKYYTSHQINRSRARTRWSRF